MPRTTKAAKSSYKSYPLNRFDRSLVCDRQTDRQKDAETYRSSRPGIFITLQNTLHFCQLLLINLVF